MNIYEKYKNTPIKVITFYLIITLVLFAYGPFDWKVYTPIRFWTLMFFYIFALILGWYIGSRFDVHYNLSSVDDIVCVRWMKILTFINFFREIVNLFRSFYFDSFNISALFSKIVSGLGNMGESYNELVGNMFTVDGSQVVGGMAFSLFNILFSFFGMTSMILGTYYYKKLGKLHQVLLVLTYVIVALSYLGRGTNIGIFRLILIILLAGIIKSLQKRQEAISLTHQPIWTIIGIVVAIVVVLQIFITIMKGRGGILYWESPYYNVGGVHLNRDSVFFNLLPSSLYMLLVSFSSYLCQGYYGMSLALRLEWKPTFGLGSSMFWVKQLSDAIPSLHESTYQYRIQQFGWDEDVQWHSIYTWLANDFSFVGVIFIMFLIGMIFSISYKDLLVTKNQYAFAVFYFMMLACIFIPANNQLAQSTDTLFAFIFVLLCWLFTRGKKRILFTVGNQRI